MKLLAKWWHLPPADRKLVFTMVILVEMIRVGLKLSSLKKVKRILERISHTFPGNQPADGKYREQVVWAASTVGRQLLGDQPCLAQALAVQMVFNRRKIPADLCIGVVKEKDGRLAAHAWVESEGQVVIGGTQEELSRYTRLPALDWRWE